LSTLPLVLQREDIRVVHAAWHDSSLLTLARYQHESITRLFEHYDQEVADSTPKCITV
jgi:hypothetical protein